MDKAYKRVYDPRHISALFDGSVVKKTNFAR